jgi:hypothetical protein
VQVSHEGKPHFIRRIFVEYCVVGYLVTRWPRGTKFQSKYRLLYWRIYFLENDYREIRVFIEGLLSRTNPTVEVM